MKASWRQFIYNRITKKSRNNKLSVSPVTDYFLAKTFWELTITVQRILKDIILIITGIFFAAFGLKGFLLPHGFIEGGATEIALLISLITTWPLAILIGLINIPFVFLGASIVGRDFAIKTTLAISGLSIVLTAISFPTITNDELRVAIFGGFFLGAGIGLSIRGGAVIDGTEVLAIYLSRKLGTTIGDIIILIHIIIFSSAAYLLSIEVALYSLITYLATSRTLDFLVEGIEEYIGVTIISSHSEEIRQMIISKLGRGVTMYNGKGGYGKSGEKKQNDIIYSVITRLEVNKLNTEIEKLDPNSFIVMHKVKDTKGGMIKKRLLKKA
jgi:uncharacterized membrane-anchored protein YitT (DUF2179 family)